MALTFTASMRQGAFKFTQQRINHHQPSQGTTNNKCVTDPT